MSNYDKISIYIPESLKAKLEEDARLFEVFKPNSSDINLNQYLSRLILGYYDQYDAETQKEVQRVSSILKDQVRTTVNAKAGKREIRTTVVENIESLSRRIVQSSISLQGSGVGRKNARLALKPTKAPEPIIADICEANREDSTSNTFVCLFQSFLSKPSYVREQIIYKETYETLKKAVELQHPVSFTHTKTGDEIHTVFPYSLTTSLEEQFNYLLCAVYDSEGVLKARSYRICRIADFHANRTEISLTETVRGYLENMKKYGPAYEINDDEECIVFLTEAGHHAYGMIYSQRPPYSEIEPIEGGYIYHFKCSKQHVEQYFRRFNAGQAIVQKPDWLRKRIMDHYKCILEQYNESV